MPLPSDYISGTITLTNGSVDFTGTGTGWLAADFREGDIILDIAGGGGRVAVVQSITGNAAGTLSKAWDGPTLTGVAYRIRYQWDSSRVSAQTRTMIEKLGNGNLESFSGVTGPGVVVMDGPHSVIVKPESDFINGVAYDVQVDTLPDRDAYDGQSVGFAVLVSDVGDGRSAVYSKASNTVGDWTDPAYVTGPIGLSPDIEVTITTLPVGDTPDVIRTDISGGYSFEFQIPAAPGFYWESAYNAALAYTEGQVVRRNGSSFIAVQDVPPGTQPSGATPPIDTAYWEILAVKGNDGAGTVTALNEGNGIAIDATDPTMPVISLASVPTATVKGRVSGGSGASSDLTGTQLATIIPTVAGDTGGTPLKGLVPAPVAGDAAANKFLKANGAWEAIPAPDTISVSVLALQVADNTNLPIFGPNWLADAFDTLTYVDTAGATNLDSSVSGVLKPVFSFTEEKSLTGTGSASAGWTYVDRSYSVDNSKTVSGIYVWSDAAYTGNARIIQRTSSSPITYVFIAGTLANFSHPGGSTWIYVPFTSPVAIGSGSFYVGIYGSGAAPTPRGFQASVPRSYFNGDVTGTVDSGWTEESSGAAPSTGVRYVSTTVENLTVRSATVPIPATPSIIEAILPIREITAATPGTDYSVEFSRDNGTTWTAATVTELFNSASPITSIIFVMAIADVSAQPSGTNIRWRLKTLTNKMIEFHGIKTDWK